MPIKLKLEAKKDKKDKGPKETVWAIVQKGDKVLMLRRGPDANNPRLWCFPGGNIEPGDTALKSVYKELEEETGIKKSKLKMVKTWKINLMDKGKRGKVLRVYILDYSGDKVMLNEESDFYAWVHVAMLYNKNLPKNLVHSNTRFIAKGKYHKILEDKYPNISPVRFAPRKTKRISALK